MQEENFRKTILGYNKEDVTSHIESLMSDNRRILKVKEDSIQNLQKKTNELELKVTRLQEMEKQFFGIQEKLQYATMDLEEKDKKIEFLSQKVEELQEMLSQREALPEPDHSREEALEKELLHLKSERERLKEKEEESNEKKMRINDLEAQLRDYHENMKALLEKEFVLESEKARIGNAILRAQEKACEMDREFNTQYEIESEKLQTYKSEIDALRLKAVGVLQLFDGDLTYISNKGAALESLKSEADPISSSHSTISGEMPQIQLIKRG